MWLQAPEGFGGITVEQIPYAPEVVAGGRTYFRAADHLVPAIIATGLGFSVCDPPEGTDLPDLPKADPVRDTAIAASQHELAQLRATVDMQKTELSQAFATIGVISAELSDFKLRAHELEQELIAARADFAALREVVPTTILKKFDADVKVREEAEDKNGTYDGAAMR